MDETSGLAVTTIDDTAVEAPSATEIALAEAEVVRAFLVGQMTDIVPDLIGGGTVGEVLASVERARGAWQRAMASRPVAAPPAVPAGATATVVDVGALPPAEKIRRALAGRG